MIRMLSVAAVASCLAFTLPCRADDKKEEVKVIKSWDGANAGVDKAKRVVITSADEWKKIWETAHSRESPAPELPKVDFDKEMVLAVFLGERASGGFSVKVNKVVKTDKGLEVFVKETKAGAGGVLTVITYPYCMVVVPKTKGDVKFTDEK